MNKEVSASKDT